MDVRRQLIVALSLSMIRVTLPGSDPVCAKHDSGVASAIAHLSGGHASGGHGHRFPASGKHDQPPCETPSQADCCQALASCGISIGLGQERQTVEPLVAVAHRGISRSAVLFSRVTAPEPPPPKA